MPHLKPTAARLALLDEVGAGRITGWPFTTRLRELRHAGWVAGPTEQPVDGKPWTVTPYGRGIRAVRLLDWGDHIVAECGDEDEPRHLGEATPARLGDRRWCVYVGRAVLVRNKAAARVELRHLAATVLAEEEAETD